MRRGRAVHANGTAPDDTSANWLRVTFTRGSRAYRIWRFNIRNTDSTNPLKVSFDNGRTFVTLATGEAYGDDHDMKHFHVLGDGGTATFEAVGTAYG